MRFSWSGECKLRSTSTVTTSAWSGSPEVGDRVAMHTRFSGNPSGPAHLLGDPLGEIGPPSIAIAYAAARRAAPRSWGDATAGRPSFSFAYGYAPKSLT